MKKLDRLKKLVFETLEVDEAYGDCYCSADDSGSFECNICKTKKANNLVSLIAQELREKSKELKIIHRDKEKDYRGAEFRDAYNLALSDMEKKIEEFCG